MTKKVIIFSLAIFFIFTSLELCAQEKEGNLFIEKGDHFIIYYTVNVTKPYVRELLRQAEKYYSDITDKLGFRRFNFWTWDNRCKIYLYASKELYYNNTKQPEWSKASVSIKDRSIHSFTLEQYFIDTILPHEMGHLIFREFIGMKAALPLWLDEGIATMVEENKGRRLAKAKEIVHTDAFIPLDKLTSLSISSIEDPSAFYAEAASVIEFLLAEYGEDNFIEYCRSLRDKEGWLQALDDVYGFEDIGEMHGEWVTFLFQ
jgi:hypothetical protein